MIAYLSGELQFKGENFVVVKNSGIGYKIFAPAEVCLKAKEGDAIELYTYQHVREDALQLFGFTRPNDLRLFEQLISISGIGPKTAINIFSEAKADDIVAAIVNGDASILKRVSGIGGKTAERIILELKNKVFVSGDIGQLKTKAEFGADEDAVVALVSLGYSTSQAREALKKVDATVTDLSQRVREALRLIRG